MIRISIGRILLIYLFALVGMVSIVLLIAWTGLNLDNAVFIATRGLTFTSLNTDGMNSVPGANFIVKVTGMTGSDLSYLDGSPTSKTRNVRIELIGGQGNREYLIDAGYRDKFDSAGFTTFSQKKSTYLLYRNKVNIGIRGNTTPPDPYSYSVYELNDIGEVRLLNPDSFIESCYAPYLSGNKLTFVGIARTELIGYSVNGCPTGRIPYLGNEYGRDTSYILGEASDAHRLVTITGKIDLPDRKACSLQHDFVIRSGKEIEFFVRGDRMYFYDQQNLEGEPYLQRGTGVELSTNDTCNKPLIDIGRAAHVTYSD